MKKIIAYYNKITDTPICYIKDGRNINFRKKFPVVNGVTSNLEKSYEFNDVEKKINGKLFGEIYLENIYQGDDHGNMTEHEYFHMREDYFKGIKQSDFKIIVREKNIELSHIRKLKLKKLNEQFN